MYRFARFVILDYCVFFFPFAQTPSADTVIFFCVVVENILNSTSHSHTQVAKINLRQKHVDVQNEEGSMVVHQFVVS